MTAPNIAAGVLADLGYILEESFGVVPPSPALTKVRRVKTTLNLTKDSYTSKEIRSDRMTSDMRHGTRKVGGDISVELSVGAFDPFLQALMGGTWTAGISKSNSQLTSVVSDAATKKFTFAGGDPVALGFRIGDVINFANLATTANNGKNFTILSFGGTTNEQVTVAETVVTDGTPDTSFTVTVVGYKLLIGNTYRSFTFERAFADIGEFLVYTGCRMNSLALALSPSAITTGTFAVVGQDVLPMATMSIDSSYSAAPTNATLSSTDATIYESSSHTALGVVTGLTFNIDNGIDGKPVIGSNTIPNLLYGNSQAVTGELTVLFTDSTLYNKFVNETESELVVKFADPNGVDFLRLFLPRIKYSGGSIDDADPQGLPVTMPFTALAPTAVGTDASAIIFQKSNA